MRSDFINFSKKLIDFAEECNRFRYYECSCCIISSLQPINLTIDLTNLNGTMQCITYATAQRDGQKNGIAVKLCPASNTLCTHARTDTHKHKQIHEHAIMLLISWAHTTNCGHRFYDLSHIICLGKKRKIHRIAPNNTDNCG